MGIPIIDEVISTLRWAIDFFMTKVPTPLKFFVFLLLLVVFGSFFSILLHFVGVHCDTSNTAYKTSMFDAYSNYQIYTAKDDVFNYSNYYPYEYDERGGVLSTLTSCLITVCNATSDGSYWDEGDVFHYPHEACGNSNSYYLFSRGGGKLFDWNFGCVECDDFYTNLLIKSSVGSSHEPNLCYNDAYKIDRDDMNTIQKTFCGDIACVPPENFYWESDTGKFTCMDDSVCGDNASTENLYVLDMLLESAGAEPLYVTSSNKNDYTRFVGISCDNDYNPNLTIASISVFDFKVWLMIMLIYILAMMLFYLRPQS